MPEEAKPVPAVVTPVETPAPLIEVVMYNLLGANWKTTAQGILSFFALNGLGLAAIVTQFGAGHAETQRLCTSAGLAVTFVSSIAKWWVGTKQMDAGPK